MNDMQSSKVGQRDWLRVFMVLAAIGLIVTGAAKFINIALAGETKALAYHDPIFDVSYGKLMGLAAVIELAAAYIILFRRRSYLAGCIVAWLASVFLAYRIGLWLLSWSPPCSCLGSLTAGLRISPEAADDLALGFLAFLLITGYWSMLSEFRSRQKL